jgi:Neuraminidase (sialidase)
VDVFVSNNNGKSWKFLSKVADTGRWNGNPPALARLKDGRLCCVFGNRSKKAIIAKYSSDDGATWGEEIILRDDFQVDSFGDPDLGYPRLVERADGRLVVMYYWATKEHPHHHIAATIWDPDRLK